MNHDRGNMTEKSYPWDGIVTGDATIAPYNDDEWSDIWSALLNFDRTQDGVVPTKRAGYWGFLYVSHLWGSTLQVWPGVAVVDGKVYVSNSNIYLNTTGAGDYSVVLRKIFDAQTVRVALRPQGVTQIDGDIWEIKLADISVDADGTHTVTDQRRFINNGPSLQLRQGNDTVNWQDAGTTWYEVRYPAVQIGVGTLTFVAGDFSVSGSITFPRTYEDNPMVFTSIISLSAWTQAANNLYMIKASVGLGGTSFDVNINRMSTYDGAVTVTFTWFAIGQTS